MRPNIDRKGRIARGVSGALFVAAAAVPWLVGWPAAPGYRWAITIVALAAGGFQLFEAKKSWCVMRACGFHTPM